MNPFRSCASALAGTALVAGCAATPAAPAASVAPSAGPSAAASSLPSAAPSATPSAGASAATLQPMFPDGRLTWDGPPQPKPQTRSRSEAEDPTIYLAVMNDEEQYSIWPADRELPPGWRSAGKTGLKSEVIAWIEEIWTDMRPLSLRKKMEESQG